MKVWFGQIYIEPGVSFPLSYLFQRRLADEVTRLVTPSAQFIKTYGNDFELMFRISAKQGIKENEIRGPTVFKKTKDVEYTIFLPFDAIMRHRDAPRRAVRFLLDGVCEVFDLLKIDKTKVVKNLDSIIEGVCTDRTMLEEPSLDDEDEEDVLSVRKVFQAFFKNASRSMKAD